MKKQLNNFISVATASSNLKKDVNQVFFFKLGGHISKVHKGISKKYKDRIIVRDSRTNERDRLKYIKKILQPM